MASSSSVMRRRSAVALCRDYGISSAEIAPLFGEDEAQFLRALKRNGLSGGEFEQKSRQLRLAEKIMNLLQKEVEALTALEEDSLSKTKLDTLALLARTIEKVGDLQERFAAVRLEAVGGLSTDELRNVLTRIDERIDELAEMRARELVQIQSQRTGVESGGPGMDDPGAQCTTAATR